MPLEAEWDPVAGKVVFRPKRDDDEETQNAKKNKPSLAAAKPSKKQPEGRRSPDPLSWRNDDDAENVPWRRRNDSLAAAAPSSSPHQQHRRRRSRGVPPTHPAGGDVLLRQLHAGIRARVTQRETCLARQQQQWRRQAFRTVTTYKSYPRQEAALRHGRALRQEWLPADSGVGVQDEGAEEQIQQQALVSSAASHSSSGTCSSFDVVVPEAKRCLRDRDCSPAQSRQIQAYQREFLQQRALPKQQHSVASFFGPALYSMEPRVFCVESSVHAGRRRYVCAHAGRFFDHYWRNAACERHAYELIPPHTPCRLYLDLECADGVLLRNQELREALLTELWQELAEELREQFGDGWRPSSGKEDGASSSNTYSYQLLPLQRHHVVDLDSSTDHKFSRHWIVHLPAVAVLDTQQQQQQHPCEALFGSSQAVGHFCRRWVGRLADEQATGRLRARGRTALDAHLFTPKEGNNGQNPAIECLVDLGVYTKNRLFRLMGSSKFGKPVTAALRIAEANEFPLAADCGGFGNECFYPPAMPQPISSSQEEEEDEVEVKVRKSVAKTDWTRHAEALAQTLVVPLNGAKMACAILPSPEVDDTDPASSTHTLKKTGRPRSITSTLATGPSTYPMIDDFVLRALATRGDVPGSIRAWSVEYDHANNNNNKPFLISYQMSRNRWCECVGRAHKSNNIAWHVDLRMRHAYQTCHDPDCRALNFRGTPVPLPAPVQQALDEALFDEELARLDLGQQPAATVRTQPVNDEFDNDDTAFEEALATLNLDELTATAVPTKQVTNDGTSSTTRQTLGGEHVTHDDQSSIAVGVQVEPQRPESSAERLARLYGKLDDDDNSSVDERGSFGFKPVPKATTARPRLSPCQEPQRPASALPAEEDVEEASKSKTASKAKHDSWFDSSSDDNDAFGTVRKPSPATAARQTRRSPWVSDRQSRPRDPSKGTKAKLYSYLDTSSSDEEDNGGSARRSTRQPLPPTTTQRRTPPPAAKETQPPPGDDESDSDCENRDRGLPSRTTSKLTLSMEDEFPLVSPQVLCGSSDEDDSDLDPNGPSACPTEPQPWIRTTAPTTNNSSVTESNSGKLPATKPPVTQTKQRRPRPLRRWNDSSSSSSEEDLVLYARRIEKEKKRRQQQQQQSSGSLSSPL